MAKQNLSIGSSANDGLGDSLRDGAIKLNNVIDEIYNNLGNALNEPGRTLDAIASFKKALDFNPTYALSLIHI